MDQLAVGGAAAATVLAIVLFVYHTSLPPSSPASRIVRLQDRSYLVEDLWPHVIAAATKATVNFSELQLSAGKLFVVDRPRNAAGKFTTPVLPTGEGLNVDDVVAVAEGKCILLDLGDIVPAGAGAAAAGGAASAELLEAIRAIPAQVAAAVNPPEVESIMSDGDYERYARGLLFGKLVEHCGLEVARGTPLDRRTLLGQQWDFRAPVRCAATRGDPRNVDGIFEAFLSEEGYIRPPNIPTRVITPTKAGGASEPISAEYLAVFEITSGSNWTRGPRPMLPRLEKRLRLSLERAKAKGYLTAGQSITDLIAVVGVASPHKCSDSVCARMDVEVPEGELHPFIHLKAMMDVGRFVFIKVPKAGSPTASAAGGGAAGR